jgi:hypothetical protein
MNYFHPLGSSNVNKNWSNVFKPSAFLTQMIYLFNIWILPPTRYIFPPKRMCPFLISLLVTAISICRDRFAKGKVLFANKSLAFLREFFVIPWKLNINY